MGMRVPVAGEGRDTAGWRQAVAIRVPRLEAHGARGGAAVSAKDATETVAKAMG